MNLNLDDKPLGPLDPYTVAGWAIGLVIALAFAVCGCAPVSVDKYIESMSKDPATLELNAAYMGGSLQLKRSMPTPVPCK